jgi:hypothetical protein
MGRIIDTKLIEQFVKRMDELEEKIDARKVLAITITGEIRILYNYGNMKKWYSDKDDWMYTVTHWMELPQKPKGSE